MKPIVLLGEYPSLAEAKLGVSFCSTGGLELLKMLDEAKVISLTAVDNEYIRKYWNTTDPLMLDMVWRLHPEVARLNVFNTAPPSNRLENFCGTKESSLLGYPRLLDGASGYIQSEYRPHLEALAEALNALDSNLVIALGNTPLWALCGTTGVSKLRGTTRISSHTVADFKVLSTYHPSAVLRQYELRPVTTFDLMKAVRENASPKLMLPEREIYIEPSPEEFEAFYAEHIRRSELLSVDIETAGNQITCIGFAPNDRLAIVVPFFDARAKNRSYFSSPSDEHRVLLLVKRILGDRTIPKLFQNGLYDIAFLWRAFHFPTYGALHDTMLLHHALQPESLKSLDFLGSVYTNESAWKRDHRMQTNKRGA